MLGTQISAGIAGDQLGGPRVHHDVIPGVLHGDLTPECAEVVRAVLDALSAPAGAEDDRSQAQRYHDGLQEAMRWLQKCVVIWVT